MKIAIIGHGAIARFVRGALAGCDVTEVAEIVRPGKENVTRDPPLVSSIADVSTDCALIVDCGGHGALRAHGAQALRRGMNVLTVSLGALADRDLMALLRNAADSGGARLQIASGAIGGLDALRAARAGRLDTVTYIGRKPPAGWIGSPAEKVLDLHNIREPSVHFEGTAREAALTYPKNANVAAAVALAGRGFDATTVQLIADPTVAQNLHEVRAAGAFGSLTFTISGHGLPANPKSSALAAMSIVNAILERQSPIGF
ncbi:aspartate dehydrogenase [Cognatiyoonia koreensis]|uniref:L-aspartate dehydrogenase n=1 Tax=Cognatiyoonia koreensis TaxID=364200 RepID=A0A1I0RX87_9RHOB|nr:aspartate dehydrogenase [Cognatiyoonia koreensis]SEW46057.1 aspartate dehydrogenase [Cognatiyoonia koreensis]